MDQTRTYRTAQGTLLNVMWQPGGRGVGGEWTHVCAWLSPFCSPETITTLLIDDTPIQNQNFFQKKKPLRFTWGVPSTVVQCDGPESLASITLSFFFLVTKVGNKRRNPSHAYLPRVMGLPGAWPLAPLAPLQAQKTCFCSSCTPPLFLSCAHVQAPAFCPWQPAFCTGLSSV